MPTDGQTDMAKLIVAFRNVANAPKSCTFCPHCIYNVTHTHTHTHTYIYIYIYILVGKRLITLLYPVWSTLCRQKA